MRAQFVKKSLDFERGKDSKSALGIGMREVIAAEMDKSPRGGEYTNDQRALDWACTYGKEKYVDWILENGRGFIKTPPKRGELRSCPLKIACINCYPSIVRKLIDNGFRTGYEALSEIVPKVGYVSNKEDYMKIIEMLLESHQFSANKIQRILQDAIESKGHFRDSRDLSKVIVWLSEYLEKISK